VRGAGTKDDFGRFLQGLKYGECPVLWNAFARAGEREKAHGRFDGVVLEDTRGRTPAAAGAKVVLLLLLLQRCCCCCCSAAAAAAADAAAAAAAADALVDACASCCTYLIHHA
jgi:hypothetical protein